MRKKRKNHKEKGDDPLRPALPVDSVEKAFHLQDEAPDLYIAAFRPHAKVINLLPRKNKKNLLHWTKWIQMGALTWEKVCQLKSRRLCSSLLPFLGL